MKNIKLAFTMLAYLLMGTFAMAQNTLVSTDENAKAEVVLGEVVIEASRDESKLIEIPSAITSLNAKQLESNQINSLEDAAAFAPNFMMHDYGTKIMSPVYIRGIGSKKNSPSVGMYVDGIPYFDNSALSFGFYDLKNLEILRGPQGTQYGRNTIGGLINITTLSPEDYQGTNVRLTAATYDNYNGTLSHYGKKGKLAYSLAANYNYEGGYFTNVYDNSMADKSTSYGARNRMIYQATDKLSFENILSFENTSQDGYPYGKIDSATQKPIVDYNTESGYDRLMINEGFITKYDADTWAAEATLSYQHIADEQNIDQDFTSEDKYLFVQGQDQNMYSFEGIIHSKGNEAFKWQGGAFAFKQDLSKTLDAHFLAYNSGYTKVYDQEMASTGLFFQSTHDVTERFSITQGVRLNYEYSNMNYIMDGNPDGVLDPVIDTAYTALKEFIVLPKLALTYKLDNATLYTSYTTGYKPGGYNSSFEEDWQVQFENEMSHNFEFGVKGEVFNNLLYFDFALFHSNLEGQQILRSLESGTGTYLDNTGESRNKGIEVALSTRPIAGFTVNIAYGYTNTEITAYEKNDSTNYNGNVSPFVPEHTFNASINKAFHTENIDFIDRINIQLGYQYFGKMYWNIENTLQQDAYGLLNANISFAYKTFNLEFWGKNITDADYNVYQFAISTGNFAQSGQPARFGTTLSVKF